MFDIHYVPYNWGVLPQIYGVSSYSIMVGLGILVGLFYYFVDARKRKVKGENVVIIIFAALFGGSIGAKLPLWLMNYKLVITGRPDIFLEGKTIVGGFLGGVIAVILIKRLMHIKIKLGNVIAPAIAIGMAIGRIGCFLGGCCFGKVCTWGIDFGDGLRRIPTQLFEVAFHFTAFVALIIVKDRFNKPGILFKYYIITYLIFRFVTEFFRENQLLWGYMTLYQILSLVGIILVLRNEIMKYLVIKSKIDTATD